MQALIHTVADMKAEALDDAVADTLAEVEPESLRAVVNCEALIDALAKTVAEVETETVRQALVKVNLEAIVILSLRGCQKWMARH